MKILMIISVCLPLVTAPPPWIDFDVFRSFHMMPPPEDPPPVLFGPKCPQDVQKTGATTLDELSCRSSGEGSPRRLADSAVVQLLVRGPDKQCEHGGICSMKVGSRVQAEVSLSVAPPSLGLSLARCSLSASSDPFNRSSTPLLVNDCPLAEGVSFTLAPPKPCIETPPTRSFSFQLGPFYNSSIQFLHCMVELCLRRTRCAGDTGVTTLPQCRDFGLPCAPLSDPPSSFKPVFHRTVTQPLLVTISAPSRPQHHPVLSGHKKPPTPTGRERWVQEVGVAAVIGVTLCSFFLGMMVTAGLWCIHSKMGSAHQGTPRS